MAHITHKEHIINTFNNLPALQSSAPDFVLTKVDMQEVTLQDFAGKNIILNIFPSIDTSVCATSVREFNKRASNLKNAIVLCVSKDLPFAHKRFCGAEGIDKVLSLSDFRNKGFSKAYGVEMMDGPLAGLLARAVVVIDDQGKIKYTELVPTIGQEPDYTAALSAVQ